jgi:hypothetical protein
MYPYRYAPQAEITGAAMTAIFNHYRREAVISSVKAHHMEDLEPETWYSVDDFIKLLSDWMTRPNSMTNLVSVGMAMIYHIEPSDDVQDLDAIQKLLRLGDFHMEHHRGSGVGKYNAQQVGEKHIEFIEDTVWPDDMIYGYLYGAAQRYLEHGTYFTLSYDSEHKRQDFGGNSTLFHLTWE